MWGNLLWISNNLSSVYTTKQHHMLDGHGNAAGRISALQLQSPWFNPESKSVYSSCVCVGFPVSENKYEISTKTQTLWSFETVTLVSFSCYTQKEIIYTRFAEIEVCVHTNIQKMKCKEQHMEQTVLRHVMLFWWVLQLWCVDRNRYLNSRSDFPSIQLVFS